MKPIRIIGGGLAGCEAALQLADCGYPIEIWEMRPEVQTPAHKTSQLAELVCSNSFKGLALTSAHGLWKEELSRLGSKMLPLAFAARVPAGESLAIDRNIFSNLVEKALSERSNIQVIRQEAMDIDPDQYTLVAPGPLCSDALAQSLFKLIGAERMYFFDSIAPVVEIDSVNMELAYAKNRWEKGDSLDFINCPLNKAEYFDFVEALRAADTVEPKPFEKGELFEGCLPVEEMARRGVETLRFGPMRPIGLMHPITNELPYAVIQLRAENREKTLYNLVGFQTRLRWGTQKEIFSKVPALREASFVRFGAMHRNTFINSPQALNEKLQIPNTKVFCAGQITGAEGYTEALGTGLYAASQMAATLRDDSPFIWPEGSCLASLARHLTFPNPDFQPMNFNFGLLPPVVARKNERKERQVEACLAATASFSPFPR